MKFRKIKNTRHNLCNICVGITLTEEKKENLFNIFIFFLLKTCKSLIIPTISPFIWYIIIIRSVTESLLVTGVKKRRFSPHRELSFIKYTSFLITIFDLQVNTFTYVTKELTNGIPLGLL